MKYASKVSMTEAAFRILAKAGKPMHYCDITDWALRNQMILTCGKTPEQSLLAGIYRDRRFERTKTPGRYRLSRYGKRLASKGTKKA